MQRERKLKSLYDIAERINGILKQELWEIRNLEINFMKELIIIVMKFRLK